MAQGIVTSHEQRTLTHDFPVFELRAYIQQCINWTDHIFDALSCTAYRSAISILTDNVRTFVSKLSRSCLPSQRSGTPIWRCE
jgi:hypothetical protein